MAKINYGSSWTKVAIGESNPLKEKDEKEKAKEKDKKKDKEDSSCDIFLLADPQSKSAFYFLLPDRDGIKGLAVNQLSNCLLAKVTSVTSIIVLRELYRTAYTGPDELQSFSDGRLNLKTHKTSHLNDADREWFSKIGHPAHFTIMAGGIGARLINHAEMYGIPAFAITAITESHYVSAESM